MASILLLDYEETEERGEYDGDYAYACHEPHSIDWTPKSLYLSPHQDDRYVSGYHKIKTDLSVEVGDTVYIVYCRYSDGDSFGYTTGYWSIMEVFATDEEAAAFIGAAKNKSSDKKGQNQYSFEYKGKTYHRDWVGYFSGLDDLGTIRAEVKALRATENDDGTSYIPQVNYTI